MFQTSGVSVLLFRMRVTDLKWSFVTEPCESKENKEQTHCGSFSLHRDRSKNTRSAIEGCALNLSRKVPYFPDQAVAKFSSLFAPYLSNFFPLFNLAFFFSPVPGRNRHFFTYYCFYSCFCFRYLKIIPSLSHLWNLIRQLNLLKDQQRFCKRRSCSPVTWVRHFRGVSGWPCSDLQTPKEIMGGFLFVCGGFCLFCFWSLNRVTLLPFCFFSIRGEEDKGDGVASFGSWWPADQHS